MKIYRLAELTGNAQNLLNSHGYSLIDQNIFNNYELFLFKANDQLSQMLTQMHIPIYQVRFQREGLDFTKSL